MSGEYDVTEIFTEFKVPLLADAAFAESLELNRAWRTAEYSTAGTNHSWMLGVDWRPINSLKIRASRAKAARAYTQTGATSYSATYCLIQHHLWSIPVVS